MCKFQCTHGADINSLVLCQTPVDAASYTCKICLLSTGLYSQVKLKFFMDFCHCQCKFNGLPLRHHATSICIVVL